MTIMQDQPSSYTLYARSLCPDWCSEAHTDPTDPRDLSAVHHRGQVGAVTVTDDYGHAASVDVRLGRWDSLRDLDEAGPKVRLWSDFPDALSPDAATEVGLLLVRAAEQARSAARPQR